MTPPNVIKTCQIPWAILYEPDLKLVEKVFLGIVWTFRASGLKLPNHKIGQMLCITSCTVSRIIARLESTGWIKITAKQSHWRQIYFAAGDKVKADDTLLFSQSTLPLGTFYFDAGGKQRKKDKKEIGLSPLGNGGDETRPGENLTTHECSDEEADELRRLGVV